MATTIRIVAGTYEGLLYGWEMPTAPTATKAMKLTFGYAAHSECIKSVSLMTAKQGKTLISGGNDESIKIYNVNKRVEVGTLMEHKGSVTCLEFFGQSHMLSGSADNSICIWRTADWNCLHILGGHKGEVTSMAVHPSGKLAFSVAKDRTLRMWNLVKGRIAYIRRLEKEANTVKMSQSGARYALGFGNEVSVFSSANAEVVGVLDHSDKIHAMAFATDEYVVCGGEDQFIYVWKANGTLVAKIKSEEILSRIRCIDVVYPHGADVLPWIVVAASNGLVQVWDMAQFTLDPLAPVESNVDVKPLASAQILSKPRVTCLTACVVTGDGEETSEPKPKKVKKVKKATDAAAKSMSSAAAAAAPRIVVEMDGQTTAKPAAPKATDSQNKKKTNTNNHNKQHNNKGDKKRKANDAPPAQQSQKKKPMHKKKQGGKK